MAPTFGSARYGARPGDGPFLLLRENHFAYAALEQLGARGQRLVFLSGPTGNGKSHLALQFVRRELGAQPNLAIAHRTAAEFAAEFAEAVESHTIREFQTRYRSLELLVLEDLRALAKRFATMQQLCFVLDKILADGGRVVLSGRQPPGELGTLLPKLINRCHAGVLAVIKPLGRDSRINIIEHFAQTLQIPISPDVAQILARELPVSPRELLATIMQLDHYARHADSAIGPEVVRRYLDGEVKPRQPTLAEINRAVSGHFRIPMASLRGHSRKRSLILPRQCAMFLARTLTRLSLGRIAEHFGQRHHSSIAHACERIKQLRDEQPDVRQHLVQITGSLGSNEEYFRG